MATPVNGQPMKEGLIASSDRGEHGVNTGGNSDELLRAIPSAVIVVQGVGQGG